ncbi:hypothetical protein MMB19_27570 (plasmid) [Ralstonia insidiosa]|nr:hypothetical protein MMB19_27570 [Ralstonia insidiosa]
MSHRELQNLLAATHSDLFRIDADDLPAIAELSASHCIRNRDAVDFDESRVDAVSSPM